MASSQAAGHQSRRLARHQKPVPEVPDMAGCAKNLEPVFAGITRPRDPTVAAVYQYSLRPVVGYAIQHVIGQVLQDPLGARSLKREQTVARARIMSLSAK